MNAYQRIFGAGPRGLLISLALLILSRKLQSHVGLPTITNSDTLRWSVFVASILGSLVLALWSAKSLPAAERGKSLVTNGAYRYFRHPLYATFLSCFNFGVAVFLNNWIFIFWAILLHGVWHWNIRSEEKLMLREFAGEYERYCRTTGRFVPRFWHIKPPDPRSRD